MILKKKIDGYRTSSGSIKNVSAELLLELRQAWEHHTGSPEQFRSEIGVKMGTLRNLLKESKKLNHVLASADAVGLVPLDQPRLEEGSLAGTAIEVTIVDGAKVIRFSNVDLLVDFMKKSA
jgi:hypothetical protein